MFSHKMASPYVFIWYCIFRNSATSAPTLFSRAPTLVRMFPPLEFAFFLFEMVSHCLVVCTRLHVSLNEHCFPEFSSGPRVGRVGLHIQYYFKFPDHRYSNPGAWGGVLHFFGSAAGGVADVQRRGQLDAVRRFGARAGAVPGAAPPQARRTAGEQSIRG